MQLGIENRERAVDNGTRNMNCRKSQNTIKAWISITLILVMLISLCSCGANAGEKESQKEITRPMPGTVIEETDEFITVVDQAGREVTAPKDIQSIALCYRVVIRFLLSLDQGEKIKGIGKPEEFLYELEPNLKNCVDVGKGVADIEALAELNPDIFFHKSGDIKTLDAVERIGIPAVGINIETPDDMKQALFIIGKFCGEDEKADKLINYYDNKLKEFKKLTESIDENEVKTAIMMGSSLGSVADGTMLQSKMIEAAGGVNPAKSIKAMELWPVAGIEQIFKWDPDFIFITNSDRATYTPEVLLSDKDWKSLTAVKNKNIYVMPAENDSWEFPGIVSLLGMEYMMKMMYPELISEEKLDKDVNELYKLCYSKKFSKDELGY